MEIVLLTALGVGGATVIGAVLGFALKEISHRFSDIVLSLAAGVMLAAGLLAPGKAQFFGVPGMLIVFACGCLCMALELPVIFRFGTTKGRIWMIAVMAIVGGLAGASASLTGQGDMARADAGQIMESMTGFSAAGVLAAALAIAAVSFVISLKFYEKREF